MSNLFKKDVWSHLFKKVVFERVVFELLLLNWTFAQGLPEDIGVDSGQDNGRSIQQKRYDLSPLIGPVVSKLYIGVTFRVSELNKSRGP